MTPHWIVVDASVAKAAGRGEGNPPAPACIAALEAIYAAGLHVAMSAELNSEWQRHQKEYASKWLVRMIGRKRFHACNAQWGGVVSLLSEAEDLPGNASREVAKDAHVVGLAMVTDRRVLSLDTRQRALLARLLARLPELCDLYWISPTESGTEDWLCAGAPEDAARALRGFATDATSH